MKCGKIGSPSPAFLISFQIEGTGGSSPWTHCARAPMPALRFFCDMNWISDQSLGSSLREFSGLTRSDFNTSPSHFASCGQRPTIRR